MNINRKSTIKGLEDEKGQWLHGMAERCFTNLFRSSNTIDTDFMPFERAYFFLRKSVLAFSLARECFNFGSAVCWCSWSALLVLNLLYQPLWLNLINEGILFKRRRKKNSATKISANYIFYSKIVQGYFTAKKGITRQQMSIPIILGPQITFIAVKTTARFIPCF